MDDDFTLFLHTKKGKNRPDRVFYRRERGPEPSVTAGVPYFVTELKKVSRICLEKNVTPSKTEMSRNEKTEMSQSWIEFLAGHHDSNMKV